MRTGVPALWPMAIGGSLAIHAGLAALLAIVPAYAPPPPFDATISIESLSRALAETVPVTAAASSVATGVVAMTTAGQGMLLTASEDASLAGRAEVESASAAKAPAPAAAEPVLVDTPATPAQPASQPLVAADAPSPDLLAPAKSDASHLAEAIDDRVNATPAALPVRPAETANTPSRPAESPRGEEAARLVELLGDRVEAKSAELPVRPAETAHTPSRLAASPRAEEAVRLVEVLDDRLEAKSAELRVRPAETAHTPGRPAGSVRAAVAASLVPASEKEAGSPPGTELIAAEPASPDTRPAAAVTPSLLEPGRPAATDSFAEAAGEAPTVLQQPVPQSAPAPVAQRERASASPSSTRRRDATSPTVSTRTALSPNPQPAGTLAGAAPQAPLATAAAVETPAIAPSRGPSVTAIAADGVAVAAVAQAGRASSAPSASPAKSAAPTATVAATIPARLPAAAPSVAASAPTAVALAPANASVVPAGRTTLQAAVVEPLEPPSALPGEEDGAEQRVRAFIAGYRGERGCLLAVVAGRQADVTEVDSFTNRPEQADILGAEATRATGAAVSARARLVSAEQCGTLDFLRGLGGSGGASLVLAPDDGEIASGQVLAGSITNFTKPVRYLLVVDDEGHVEPVPGLTAVGADTVRFSAPMTLTSGPVRTVQLLVAVGSDAPLASIERASRGRADAYFPALIEEVARGGAQIEYGVAPFAVR